MSKYFKYTPAMLEFLENNVAGTPLQELTDQFNKKFGCDLQKQRIAAVMWRRGWGNGLFHKKQVFLQHICDFMAANCKGNRAREMAVLLNETFGTSYTEKQIASYYRKHGLKSGVASRYVPIGTLIFRKGAWYYEKVADGPNPNENWKSKHVMVWEEANGPVPEGHMVIFLDGDRRNYSLENLALCEYDVGMEMNQRKLRFANAEATKTGMLIARINVEAKKRDPRRREKG